jgi:hypothetical protein
MKPFHHLRNLLRGSYWEGALYAIMVGSTESFALYFALKSGISYSDLGLLSTLPIVFGSICQWVIPQFVRDNNARFLKLFCYGIQVLGILALIQATRSPLPRYWLFSGLSLYWIGGMSSGPLWLQWLSSEIPPKVFSIFFSKRNAFVSIITVFAYLSTSVFLSNGQDLHRFLAAFVVGALARTLGLAAQAWISRPSVSAANNPHFPREILRDPGDSSPRFINPDKVPIIEMFLFTIFFRVASNISSPFFMPFMVRELKYSLLEYTALTSIPFVGRFLFLSNWGRSMDGMKPFIGLTIAGFGISTLPALWVTFPVYGFLLSLETISGMMWGGFELCCLMVLRMKYGTKSLKPIALHMALMNLGATLGAKMGGHLLEGGLGFSKVFYLSSGLRFIVTTLFLLRISSLPLTYQSIRAHREFLSTVLSIRPSMANLGRILWLRRRTTK